MRVKIDTKEKFRVFNINEPLLHANLAEKLKEQLLFYVDQPPYNAIVIMKSVEDIDEQIIMSLCQIQALYKQKNASFVLTGFHPEIQEKLKTISSYLQLNRVPTLEEAANLVMMEDIERDLNNDV